MPLCELANLPGIRAHADFRDASADVTLISCDGVAFDIASSHLARTSEWFRGMLELPTANASKQSNWRITLAEDTLTLEVLLKVALGLPPDVLAPSTESGQHRAHSVCSREV